MVDISGFVVRFLHIAFGIAWIGAVMYGVGVLRRALARMDAPDRKATMRALIPVVTRYVPGAGAMTILFGAILYLYLGQLDPRQLLDLWGLVLLTALALTLAAFGLGMVLGIGRAKRIFRHLQEQTGTHGPEVGALQK